MQLLDQSLGGWLVTTTDNNWTVAVVNDVVADTAENRPTERAHAPCANDNKRSLLLGCGLGDHLTCAIMEHCLDATRNLQHVRQTRHQQLSVPIIFNTTSPSSPLNLQTHHLLSTKPIISNTPSPSSPHFIFTKPIIS